MFNKLKNKFMANLAGHLAPFLAPKSEAPVVLEADVTHGRQTINCADYSAMNKASLLTPQEAQNLLALSFQRTPKDFKVTLPSGASYAMDEMDGGCNLATKSMFGIDGVANAIVYTFFAKHGFIGWQLCSMLAQHWLINRACRIPNEDALSSGWQLEWQKESDEEVPAEEKAKQDKILLQAVETANQKFHVTEKALQFGVNRSIYGQALAYFEIEGDDPETPLNIDGIKPGSFKGISIVEPYWAFPDWGENSMTPGTLNFYQPEFYTIGGKRIHKSRLVTKPFVAVPDILKPSYYFGGIPLTQMIYERVYAAEKTANEVPELALTKRMLVVDANINDMIARPDAFISKANMLWRERNNKGVFYKNPQENVSQVDTNLSDLDNNVWTQYQLVAAVSSMPADRLLGTSPKGFQSTGEYERRTYAQTLKSSYQEICYREFLEKAHAIVLKSEFNVADPFLLNFNPIDTPTQAEKAQTQLTQANRDIALVSAGIISPDEARQALASDKESGYSNLSPEAPEPEMPDLDALLKDGNDEPQGEEKPKDDGEMGNGEASAADEWNEADHPRKDNGQFGTGSGGTEGISKTETVKKTQEKETNQQTNFWDNEQKKEDASSLLEKESTQKNIDDIPSVNYREVAQKEADRLYSATGLDLAGFVHQLTAGGIRHIFKSHGDEHTEKARGQLPVTKEDILLIPNITGDFDEVALAKEKSEGRAVLIYKKKIGDMYFYYETVGGKKNKTLQPKTMYKRKAK
ncbi:MAG: anti-CBASS protein Acb1 family protein [Candidatus Avelusimicrobium sp.]|uniref:anti-CBASS protein Acb1 family protein n=1 Tax=Candidatus Avelusimicrobium sp. TaxID=3048833 RepID=UPI003EFCD08D